MGVSDDGNDPMTLTQTWRPCARVQRADHDFVALVVPGGAGVETQFNLVGVHALARAGPVNSIESVQGSRAKKLL